MEKVTRPLTDRQLDLLMAMQRGVEIRYMPSMGRFNQHAHYYRSDNGKRCTSEAKGLIDRHLARHVYEQFSGRLVLTHDGKTHSHRNAEAN